MKLSFAISLQKTDFNYIVQNNGWRQNLKLMADLGYQGVELGIRHPEKTDVCALNRILEKHKLQLSAIGTGQAYIDEGLSLSSLKSNIRQKAINRIKKHIELASIFNTQVIIGLVRGKLAQPKDFPEKYKKNLMESTKRICDYAVSKGVILTIEPLNRYETNFLNNTEQTLGFIEQIKCKNLRLLLDTFHMNIEENNLFEPVEKGFKYLSHFHLADSNRRCPGQGHIDFPQIIGLLKKTGYQGYLSAEVLPLPSAKFCINSFYKLIQPLLE